MKYEEEVNKRSMEQIGYYLLHRPSFNEELDYYIASYTMVTPENFIIFTNKDSLIKQLL
jgi:hypothetical protein